LSTSIASTELNAHGIARKAGSSPLKMLVHFSRRRPLGVLSAVMVLALLLVGTIGPFVAPYDPDDIGVTRNTPDHPGMVTCWGATSSAGMS
jgi:hypothetical protein